MRSLLAAVGTNAALAVTPLPALAAETVHLYLLANGQPIKGESTQKTLGRQDSIECVYYDQKVSMARDAATGMTVGRRQYEPILIRKRIDKSSPLLAKALTQNQNVDGTFKFFRASPAGDGTTQQFYTVAIKHGRVASIRQVVPDIITPASNTQPPLEEVTFVFGTIAWTYTEGGITNEDTWSTR